MLRHTFETNRLEPGYDVRQIRSLLGHERPEITQVCTHIVEQPASAVTSPLYRLKGVVRHHRVQVMLKVIEVLHHDGRKDLAAKQADLQSTVMPSGLCGS